MSGVPQFASSAISAAVAVSVANANRDGTGTVGVLYTAPVGGARIDDISIKASATTTAGMIRLFLHSGTTFYLWKEIPVAAIVASATVATFEQLLSDLALVLDEGWSVQVSTQNAEPFNILVTNGGEF